jgi:hypothetical protein
LIFSPVTLKPLKIIDYPEHHLVTGQQCGHTAWNRSGGVAELALDSSNVVGLIHQVSAMVCRASCEIWSPTLTNSQTSFQTVLTTLTFSRPFP